MTARKKPPAIDPLLGTRLDGLKEQIRLVSAALLACEPREAAALSRELRLLRSEIETLAPAGAVEGSKADELARRRTGRVSGSADSPVTGRRALKGRSG